MPHNLSGIGTGTPSEFPWRWQRRTVGGICRETNLESSSDKTALHVENRFPGNCEVISVGTTAENYSDHETTIMMEQ